jgi:drug/metabolite transporter (DMT)-like permease
MRFSYAVLGHSYALLVIIIWGLTFVSCKILLNDFSPVEILFNRFLIATLCLVVVAPKALKFESLKVECYAAIVGFSGITLYFVFENNALIFSNSSNVSLIVSSSPFFVAILNYFLDKTKLGLNFYIGFIIAIVGIAFLSMGTLRLKLNPLGDILALGSAVSWGLYSLYVVKLQRLRINSLYITIKSFFYAVVFTLPLMWGWGYELKIGRLLDETNLINYLFLAIIASSLSFYFWSKSVEYIGSVKTSVYLYAIPVVTAVGAHFIINEQLTVYSFVGIALAILGLVVSQTSTLQLKQIMGKAFSRNTA